MTFWGQGNVSSVCIGVLALFVILLPSKSHAEARFNDYNIGNARPFNLTGSVFYGYGFNRAGDSESEINQLGVRVNGNSAIWRPWFANLSAGLGLAVSTSDNTTGAESDSNSSNLNLAFALFPISRFPFRLTFSRSVNNLDAFNFVEGNEFLATRKTTSTRLGLQQQYTTRTNTNYFFWYTNSDIESDVTSEFSTSTLGFRVHKNLFKQRIDVNANYVTSEQKQPSFEVRNFNVSASHGYYPSQEMGVTTVASHSIGESDSEGVGGPETTVSQVGSNFSWRPTNRAYTVSGGVRFSQSGNDDGTTDSTARTVSTSATASYRFSRQTRGSFGANVSASESGGSQTLTSSETATIGFSSEQYSFLGLSYSWGLGAGLSNSNSTIEGSTAAAVDTKTSSQSASSNFGHSVGKNWAYDTFGMHLNVSQGIGVSKTFSDDPLVTPVPPATTTVDEDSLNKSLTNSANFGGNHYAFGGNTVFSVSLTDTRTFQEDNVSFQLLTAQLARDQDINRLSSASANIYFQATKTDDTSTSNLTNQEDTQKSASASASYQHGRVFGIFGLRYKTTLEQTSLLSTDDSERGNLEWSQHLDYKIGKLSAKLSARIIENPDGDENLNMFFQATRTF